MRNILLLLFVSLFLFGCPIDNRIGAKFTEKKVIKNRSDYETRIILYSFSDIFLDVTIVAGDSVVSSAYCEVTGSQKGCTEIEGNYNNLLFEELADSMHIIFDDEKIFRYVRQEIGSCAGEDVLLSSPSCGYIEEGIGTGLKTYTYEITNEFYENAEPIEGGG